VFISWVLFPLVLAGLCLGWGILLRALPGVRIPRALVPGAGMAAIVVAGQALTYADATAELATPVIAAGAVIGLGVGAATRLRPPPAWALAAAGATFAVYAAPIVLSGDATLAGFIKLDDTATWLALTDHIMEHGRSLEGLAPSTYEATLAFNLGDGYPVGVFVPLGAGAAIVGEDPAWVVQPYMAFWTALLALALWSVARGVLGDPRARAAAAFVGSQAALLFGYYLWGGIKEVAAIALIATVSALLPAATARGASTRVVPPALAAGALIGVLSGGGALWLAPILGAGAVACARALGPAATARRAAAFAAVTAIAAIPVLTSGGVLPPTSSPLTDSDAIGNLAGPLDPAQVAGVWPAGDFRDEPASPGLAYAIAGIALAGAALGVVVAWRRRAWWAATFVAGVLAAAVVLALAGSPWVEGKALATASVVIPFAAILGAGALWAGGGRVVAVMLGALVAGGVLWSNVLQYGAVNLAPRDQLVELERIGELVAGEGPTLMTEYNPFGARHFLREADAEGVSELRRRLIPLAGGDPVPRGLAADTDELEPEQLLVYRSLVLRRSPVRSRPPFPYRLEWRGRSYELWQRPDGPVPAVERLALGAEFDAAAVPECDEVLALARGAEPGGELLAAEAPRPLVFRLADALDGVEVEGPARYQAWVLGSVRGSARLLDGEEEIVEVRHQLNHEGGYVGLGGVELGAGPHELRLELGQADLHPGSAGARADIGPLVLVREAEPSPRVAGLPARRAPELCGRRWDWIEAVRPKP
jgi:hypothetical protein